MYAFLLLSFFQLLFRLLNLQITSFVPFYSRNTPPAEILLGILSSLFLLFEAHDPQSCLSSQSRAIQTVCAQARQHATNNSMKHILLVSSRNSMIAS